jgi:hypothetical protein
MIEITAGEKPETQGCILIDFFLLRKVRLRWKDVVPQRTLTPQRLTLFTGEQATKASSCSTKRRP